MTATTVGVVGLGRMGGNMAHRLLEEGLDVIGADLDETAVDALEAAGGDGRSSPAVVAAESDVVVSSLPDPPTVEAVYTAEDGPRSWRRAPSTPIRSSRLRRQPTLRTSRSSAHRSAAAPRIAARVR